jgi:hypothetical protein
MAPSALNATVISASTASRSVAGKVCGQELKSCQANRHAVSGRMVLRPLSPLSSIVLSPPYGRRLPSTLGRARSAKQHGERLATWSTVKLETSN